MSRYTWAAPRDPAFCSLKTVQFASAQSPWLMFFILASVFFSPTLRLQGDIPVRIDDIVIFGAGAFAALRALLGARRPKVDSICIYLLVLVSSILLSNLAASLQMGIQLTLKEYLDLLRPVKFLLAYLLIRRQSCHAALQSFIRIFSVCIGLLLFTAIVEMLLARLVPASPALDFFSQFSDQPPLQDPVEMMSQRPFATFNTPTHLGYVATLGIFLSPVLASARGRKCLAAVSFLTLLISVTRTFLFSLPLMLIGQSMMRGGSSTDKIRRVAYSTAVIVVVVIFCCALLPLVSPVAADYTSSMIVSLVTGDTQDEYSITTRLENLALVVDTWNTAPLLGVATRSLLPDYVDSELILQFHRYGIVGIAMLAAFYAVAHNLGRRVEKINPPLAHFVIMSLVVTLLYGITQGALSNSRIGVIPFMIFGIASGFILQGQPLATVFDTGHMTHQEVCPA